MAITNSSSLQPHVCLTDNNAATSSKIAVNVHQANHGFTIGTVLRWNSALDGHTYGYTAAQANNAYNAEVVGIVSQVIGSNDFELCVGGIVNMTSFFSNTTGILAPGATQDDVYFLSGYTAGWMTTERPTTTGWVAKPVMTRIAHDANDRIFGCVTNYVGSLLGGNIAVSLGNLTPPGTIQAYLGEKTAVPSGWAYCDGAGYLDTNGIPGFNITTYPEYYSAVGKKYGWIEKLNLRATPAVGDKIRQVVGQGNNVRTISGIVVAVITKSDSITTEVYVKQTWDNTFLGDLIPYSENSNFYEKQNSTTRGSEVDEIDKEFSPVQTLAEFEHSTTGTSVIITSRSQGEYSALNLTSSDSGVYSVLPPDLRGRSLFGGQEKPVKFDAGFGDTLPDVVGTYGGHRDFRLTGSANVNEDGVGGNLGLGEKGTTPIDLEFGWALKQSNLPPYMTVNWIVRVDPTAYASLIDKLEVKQLKLTGLPTSSLTTEYQEVYNDSGILKIDNTE